MCRLPLLPIHHKGDGKVMSQYKTAFRLDLLTHPSLWQHEPNNCQSLECVVHWQEVENNVDEGLDKVEGTKDDPVCEPVYIYSQQEALSSG